MLEHRQTDEHRIFREAFRRFVQKEITPHVRDWEAAGRIPRSLWLALGREGYLCPRLPEEYGGCGLDYLYSVIIDEELVRGDAFGTGIPLHNDVAVPYIQRLGTAPARDRWLPACARGEAVAALAMTEPDAGSDLSAIRTRAERDGDRYVINGQKTFITNGATADVIVLAAKTDPDAPFFGVSLFLIQADDPGFSRGRVLRKMGCHMQDTAELYFSDCRIPVDRLLGREGMGGRHLLENLPEERLEIAVKCQAAAETLLADTLAYVKTRKAFGKPIGAFQHNAFRLAEMATEVELGRAFLERILEDYLDGRDVVSRTAMAKYWLSEAANRIAAQAVQLHGGYGYMEEYRVCRLYRDLRVTTIYAGTNEIMKSLISRQLGLRT